MSGNRTFWGLLEGDETPPPPPPGGVSFAMTEIPYADPDIITYGRGAEQWHYPCTNPSGCNGAQWDRISNPSAGSNAQWVENSKNVYHRFQWRFVESNTQGVYTIVGGVLGNAIENAINNDQMLSFGIMPLYSGEGQSIGGGLAAYPTYLHNLMMAAPDPDDRPQLIGGTWVPAWNHASYLSRLRALHVAINNHLLTATHTFGVGHPREGETVNVRDSIYAIDIRGFGDYGEWHMSGFYNMGTYNNGVFTPGDAPGNNEPTVATMKEIIDCHTEVFQDWPLLMMVAGFNGYDNALSQANNGSSIGIFHHSAEIAHYAIDASNNWGPVGYRRDQVLATDNYLVQLLSANGTRYPTGVGDTIATKFLNIFETSPGTGEPLPGAYDNHDLSLADANIQLYKHTSFGNGNYPVVSISATDNTSSKSNQVRNAFKRCGFRLKVTTGEAPQVITRNILFTIKLNWVNVGVAPTYENWNVVFELQSGTTPVWSATSTKILKRFKPSEGVVQTTDILTVTTAVSVGTYKLVFRVEDPTGYKAQNLKLALQGQNADGSYTIFNTVTVN